MGGQRKLAVFFCRVVVECKLICAENAGYFRFNRDFLARWTNLLFFLFLCFAGDFSRVS